MRRRAHQQLLRPASAAAARTTRRSSPISTSSAKSTGKTYLLSAVGHGNASRVQARHHLVRTDVPRAMGGADAAPQPVELLLAALIGCEQATAKYVARHMKPRLELRGIAFEYRAERDDRGATSLPIDRQPPCEAKLQRVSGTAVVYLAVGDTTADDVAAAAAAAEEEELDRRIAGLQAAVETRCPVANTLKAAGCRLETRWRAAADADPAFEDL